MKGYLVAISILLFVFQFESSIAQTGDIVKELQPLMDSIVAIEAPIFAPETFSNAERKFQDLKRAVEYAKKQQYINEVASDFKGYAENAIKATGVARLSLSEYLPPRDKARRARAHQLVPQLYQAAETQFVKATKKVESGDVKGGIKEADKASPLFDKAELEAIRVDILGKADKLIAAAIADEGLKYAYTTMDKARTARNKADEILLKDRYERKESLEYVARAEYEARHGSNISQLVRSLERNDQAWEKLMLGYEIEMQKIANEFGIELLQFDTGPMAAADSLVRRIRSLKEFGAGKEHEAYQIAAQTEEWLKSALARFGAADSGLTLAEKMRRLDTEIATLLDERQNLAKELQEHQVKIAELTKTQQEISTELDARREKEDKLSQAKRIINPSEGEVLFNASNDIVLRLIGLSFAPGKSDIADEHVPILNKVIDILRMFPDSKLMIEGHTDNTGDPAGNIRLSEKRAIAVMQYLRQALTIPADRVQSAGYGADRPVASNDTPDGRTKNRRIDIIIMQ